MKSSRVRATAAIGSLATLLSACGGDVSLGGKGSQANGAAGAAQTPDQIQPVGERVLERSDLRLSELIATGDYLYFVGQVPPYYGIFRCRKADCEATFGLFLGKDNVAYIQAFGDRLGFRRLEYASYGFASVAFSDAKDERVVIRGLPGDTSLPPLFHDDFVFFSVPNDRSLYRCSLPACADNPERLAGAKLPTHFTPRAFGDLLIWSDGPFIYRVAGYGTEPAMVLLPDDSLSEAPATVLSSEDPEADLVTAIDADNGVLYASIQRSRACEPDCPYDLVAWPVLGGAARHLFTSERRLSNLRAFDNELVWTSQTAEQRGYATATVSTCRIEACDATRRDLGESSGELSVSADEQHIYWIHLELTTESLSKDTSFFQPNQIRRAPRLPAP